MARSDRTVRTPLSARSVTFSEARRWLTAVLRDVDEVPEGTIGVTVRGRVQAYLVSRWRLEYLEALARDHERRSRVARYRLRRDEELLEEERAEQALAEEANEPPDEPARGQPSRSVARQVAKLLRAVRKGE